MDTEGIEVCSVNLVQNNKNGRLLGGHLRVISGNYYGFFGVVVARGAGRGAAG
jgi:hypothetical protein